MASFGIVLDLLDDRYLNLHDVTGNVQSFPTLVPYEQYTQNMIVYRMDNNLEVLLGMLHEFTNRASRALRKELWTWCIQWEVEEVRRNTSTGSPATKKPRTDSSLQSPVHESPPRKPPAYTQCERRCLHPALFDNPKFLRVLIDIVQADSRVLPNFVEFLYEWIDFHQGGGTALQAALRMEIPSLWLFKYHPLTLAAKYPRTAFKGSLDEGTQEAKLGDPKAVENEQLQEAATKIGEKLLLKEPDLAALERRSEESERMQYREVKFGLQPPLDPNDEPLTPLINIPRGQEQRNKYYAACFRNRQRALWLLQEAGLSARQVANYRRTQDESLRETREDIEGIGFANYYKDEPYAHEQFTEIEKIVGLREKQNEIATSTRLSLEAQLAAVRQSAGISDNEGTSSQHAVPPPLILPTPMHPGRRDITATFLQRIRAMAQKRDLDIRLLPLALHGRVKSKILAKVTVAPVSPAAPTDTRHPSQMPRWPWDDTNRSDSEGDDESEVYSGDDIDPDERDDDVDDHLMDLDAPANPFSNAPNRPPIAPSTAATALDIPSYIQGLSLTQVTNLLPLLTNRAQQAVLQGTASLNPAPQPTLSGQMTGIIPATSTATNAPALGSLQAAGLQVPASMHPTAGPMQTQNARPGLPSGSPGTNITPPAQTQAPQNANPIGPLGPASAQLLRIQQLMAARGLIAEIPAAPASLGTPGSVGASASRPTQLLASSSIRTAPPAGLHLQQLPHPEISPTIRDTNHSPVSLSPLAANLGSNLTITSSSAASPHGIPILIYLPQIILPSRTTPLNAATDCMLLGYTRPNSGTLTLTRAIFLPVGVWGNILNRVRKGDFSVLETYTVPPNHPRLMAWKGLVNNPDDVRGPHKTVYDKLCQIYGMMANCMDREEEVTKRWRASPGPLTATKRGGCVGGVGFVCR